ncbi:MAG: DUF6765 family protein [Rhizobacter sp.]
MQIDFHHAVTYVVARLAGLADADARTVAHAAQYVDDATTDGPLTFVTGERYVRVTSAHKTLDWLNTDRADNRLVWVPFHFLPGNAAPPPGSPPADAFLRRMMCQPDSDIARAMVLDCVRRRELPYALHRLGVALHTYVDTWAHQQFVGVVCDLNRIRRIDIEPDPAYAASPVFRQLTSGTARVEEFLAGHVPVGHAGVLTLPDLPFLKWSFVRRNGEAVHRDNPADFLRAAEGAYNMARRYAAADEGLGDEPLPAADRAAIDCLLRQTLFVDGEDRHRAWLDAIRAGAFSFGPADVTYVDQGAGSWKMVALGADPDDEEGIAFEFSDAFLASDWKRFHDAVQHQRLFILHDLLPRAGLCAS